MLEVVAVGCDDTDGEAVSRRRLGLGMGQRGCGIVRWGSPSERTQRTVETEREQLRSCKCAAPCCSGRHVRDVADARDFACAHENVSPRGPERLTFSLAQAGSRERETSRACRHDVQRRHGRIFRRAETAAKTCHVNCCAPRTEAKSREKLCYGFWSWPSHASNANFGQSLSAFETVGIAHLLESSRPKRALRAGWESRTIILSQVER